jgi:uncharacterized FAD-dependent dehydrogenase
MTKKYDVIIVGSGPAGIFAALELSQSPGLRVLLIEKGKDIDKRINLVCGLGGAGAYSDGKLTLTPEVGGRLQDYLGKAEAQALIKHIDDIYLKFGAPDKLYGVGDEISEVSRRASLAGLRLIPVPLRHLGTERCRSVLKAMRDYLVSRLELRLEVTALTVTASNGKVRSVETEAGDRLDCDYLILAPGREGADWLATEAKRLKLTLYNNPVDVGIRVEVPVAVMAELTNVLYEAKLEFLSQSFDDRIRTFCMCPAGEVAMETTGGSDPVITVNGHSYANSKSQNTNFALLVSTDFTEPFREPIAYGRYLARLANILSGGVLLQRLGDLMEGHRSTPTRIERGIVKPTLKEATPGDLSFVLPYRHLTGILEMMQALDKLAPGVASRHTLLYGVEVKFYSCRPHLSPHLETEVENMFAAGDGAGVSRGLIQASASGVVAAREILRRSGRNLATAP